MKWREILEAVEAEALKQGVDPKELDVDYIDIGSFADDDNWEVTIDKHGLSIHV
jgi:hypothetical protein